MRRLVDEATRRRRHRVLDLTLDRATSAPTAVRCRAGRRSARRAHAPARSRCASATPATSRRRGGRDFHVDEAAALAKRIGRPVSWAAIMANVPRAGRGDPHRGARAGDGRSRSTPRSPAVRSSCRSRSSDPVAVRHRGGVHRDPRPAARSGAGPLRRSDVAPTRGRTDLQAQCGAARSTARSWPRAPTTPASSTARRSASWRPRGRSQPLDVMVDLSLAEDLETKFRVPMVNDDDDQIAELLQYDEPAARPLRRRRPHQPALRRELRHLAARATGGATSGRSRSSRRCGG